MGGALHKGVQKNNRRQTDGKQNLVSYSNEAIKDPIPKRGIGLILRSGVAVAIATGSAMRRIAGVVVNELAEMFSAETIVVLRKDDEVVPSFIDPLRRNKTFRGRAGFEKKSLHVVEELFCIGSTDGQLFFKPRYEFRVSETHDSLKKLIIANFSCESDHDFSLIFSRCLLVTDTTVVSHRC